MNLPEPDYERSPHTGFTRDHWKAQGLVWTEAMFNALPSMEEPLFFPKKPGKTYPHEGDPPERYRAAEFEGLVRSLNMVAPLIEEDPELSMRGVRLIDYYRRELRAMIDPASPRALPLLSELEKQERFPCRQMTCEFGGLSLVFLLFPRIWNALDESERDRIAVMMTDYAHGLTNAHNWRYFNVMMMLFLHVHGYSFDEARWGDHLDALLSLYAGNGWFRDQHFDYYIAWVFHLYAPYWCRFYGNEHEPKIVQQMEAQGAAFMETYPRFFGRDGSMPMWGRSIAYRNAAFSAIPACLHYRNPPGVNCGWLRRICSGSLLLFARHESFLENGVPALGYYGHFEPCLQFYSCAASPMWSYLNFLSALSLPESHPFWTATENEGEWSELGVNIRETTLEGPGLLVVNYGASAHSELRTAKAEQDDPNYSRLAYHTAFPWEALDPDQGMAMHYAWESDDDTDKSGFLPPVHMFWCGHHDGVLYRQAELPGRKLALPSSINLADISLPMGVLRIDQPHLIWPNKLRLAHFGLPHIRAKQAEILAGEISGYSYRIARIPGRQVALVALDGWDRVDSCVHEGCHPEAETSTLLYAEAEQSTNFTSLRPRLTLLLHKCDDSEWKEEELLPVRSCHSPRISDLGIYGVEVTLSNGLEYRVSFEGMEGRKQG